jgi:hypothetical protein
LVLFYNFCVADSLRIGPGSSGPDVIKSGGDRGAFCGDCKRFEIGRAGRVMAVGIAAAQ